MRYLARRLKYEAIGLMLLIAGVTGVIAPFFTGFWNPTSAAYWIAGLIPFIMCRRLAGAGIWTGMITLVCGFGVGAMCVLYALTALCLSPLVLMELAVYAPRAPEKLGEGAFLFAAGYALPGVIWLKLFLD